ncbi:hypothetical protein [Methylosinus sp. Ce-a6]
MQQFARMLSRDIDAVRNAIVEHWKQRLGRGANQSSQNVKARHVGMRRH